VSDTSVAEGGEAPSSEAPVTPEAPTTDFAAEATEYKNRFAGSQRKLTETLAEKARLEAEAESLRQWKAEKEKADMSEVERLQAERDEARAEAEAARSEAQRATLARTYPLAVEFYGDDALPSEERLAALNERLAKTGEETEAPEPPIDPNNPRKAPPAQPDPMDAAERWLRSTLEGN
jgi:chromosome segregation ATPase